MVDVRYLCIASIFFAAAVGATGARCLKASARLLSLGLIFGGGVFVSAGFIHLLGSAQQAFAAYTYPWATLFCSVGVMATLLVEESTIAMLRWREAKQRCQTCPPTAGGKFAYGTSLLTVTPTSPLLSTQQQDATDACPTHPSGNPESKAMAVILYLALSFHSFMEGLGVGVSSAQSAWALTFAIVAHKGIATFALGTSIVRQGVSTYEYLMSMLPFCFVTPAGVLVGMSIQNSGNTLLTNTVLSLAGGTFICIGLMEIIAKELPGDDKLLKIFLVLLGWGIFAVLAIWC